MNREMVNVRALSVAVSALMGEQQAGMLADLYRLLDDAEKVGFDDGRDQGFEEGAQFGSPEYYNNGYDLGYQHGKEDAPQTVDEQTIFNDGWDYGYDYAQEEAEEDSREALQDALNETEVNPNYGMTAEDVAAFKAQTNVYGGTAAALITDEGNVRPASEELAEALGLEVRR